MSTPKNILVVTSSTLDGIKIKQYLKPVSAHVVAGTNMFSDFMGGLTDVFGGRSQSYQKQLTSLYNEAILRVKHSAYELGANCVIGLTIDMDEISGKGKSMFMLTAIGTAVVLEKESIIKSPSPTSDGLLENVGVDRINALRRKKAIIEKANDSELQLSESTWAFITENQIHEVFPFLLKRYETLIRNEVSQGDSDDFSKLFASYVDALPENTKLDLLYDAIKNEDYAPLATRLSKIVKELHLFDYERVFAVLKSDEFTTQKRGLTLATFDKLFYNHQDKKDLSKIASYIESNFKERGTRSVKKQLLGKEKEVWACECGKTNDIDEICGACKQDIYGFKETQINPKTAFSHITQKVELINEFIAP